MLDRHFRCGIHVLVLAFILFTHMSEDERSQFDDKEPPPPARHNIGESSEATKVNQPASALSTMSTSGSSLPPLSLSILGVEPLDEFIREIADFVHHKITTRPNMHPQAKVEVEAKLGVLRDRSTGQRLMLPVLVETSLFSLLVYSWFSLTSR